MKYLLLFLVVLATSQALPANVDDFRRLGFHLGAIGLDSQRKSDINKDIQDFINLVPRSKIEDIVKRYIETDLEVRSDWDYGTSEATKQKVQEVEQSPEFMDIRKQLEAKNVNMASLINQVHDIIGMEHVTMSTPRQGDGLRGLLDEVRPTVPMTKIKLMAAKKYLLSSEFRHLVSLALSREFQEAVKRMSSSAVLLEALADAEANGVDMEAVYDFIDSFSLIFKGILYD